MIDEKMNRLHRRLRGFTLIEVMIVMAIIGILAAIAIPQYSAYIRRGYRGQARSEMMQMAQAAERFRGEKNTYTGFAPPTRFVPDGAAAGTAKYTVDAVAGSASTFTVTAVPVNSQSVDECGTFTLTETGQKTAATLSSGSHFLACWGR